MKERFTTNVAAWAHDSIQDEPIESVELPNGFRIDADAIPVVISEDAAQTLMTAQQELFQVSPHHGRSYEVGPNVDGRGKMSRLAIWKDQYENHYASVSLKGNNFSTHHIMESATAPSGYIPMGLQESDALYRIVKASRILREQGIPTEWIHGVYEPRQLVFNGELVSQAVYKKRLLDHTMHQYGIEEAVKVAQAIEPMTFFITARSMMVNDRLTDLMHDTPEQARQRLRHVFHVGNTLFKENEDFRKLLPSRPQDRDHFFSFVYPTLLGQSIAALHNAGLVHSFPTLSNTTLLGGIIDLDSVKGAPLGINDASITAADVLNDLTTITKYDHPELTLRYHYKKLHKLGVIRNSGLYAHAEHEFVFSYSEHRKKPETAKDAAVRELIKLGASQLPDNDAERSLAILAPDHAAQVQAMIESHFKEKFDEVFCKENIQSATHVSIDGLLHRKFNSTKRQKEGAVDLYITDTDVEALVDIVLKEMRFVVSFGTDTVDFQAVLDDPVISKLFPGTTARELLYEELYVKYREAQFESSGVGATANGLRENIENEIHAQLTRLAAEFLPSHSDNYHRYIPRFSGEINQQSSSMLWFKGKVIYGYAGVAFSSLLKQAHESNIEIIVDTRDNASSLFDYPNYVAREAYSSSDEIELWVSAHPKVTFPAATLHYETTPDSAYLAWLCEATEHNGRPTLHILHEDPAAALAAVAKLSSNHVSGSL